MSVRDFDVDLITCLGLAPRTRRGKGRRDVAELNRRAVRYGYAIQPDCCNETVARWLDTLTENPNATFYRGWRDVVKKDRFELLLDQLAHYATTYGTGFSLGNGFVPNTGALAPEFSRLKVVRAASSAEIARRCWGLVRSGAALKETTVKTVCDYLVDWAVRHGEALDLGSVKCKEAQAYLSVKLGRFPADEFGLLRAVVYAYTGSCMLVKDDETIKLIRQKSGTVPTDEESGIEGRIGFLRNQVAHSREVLEHVMQAENGASLARREFRKQLEEAMLQSWYRNVKDSAVAARVAERRRDGAGAEVTYAWNAWMEKKWARTELAAERRADQLRGMSDAAREAELANYLREVRSEEERRIAYKTEKIAREEADLARVRAAFIPVHSPLLDLGEVELKKLARIFLRYKPLFLAMKTPETAPVVNRLRKLAKRLHTPLKPGFWETVFATPHTEEEIMAALGKIDNFRKVRVLQGAAVALRDEEAKAYVIRNGKLFVRRGHHPRYDRAYLETLRRCVRKSLVRSLAGKACRVKYPEDFSLAVPSSEKSFVGNLPFGTRIRFSEHNVVGIYWRNEWGTNDFDLSFTDYAGHRVSWCSDYGYGARTPAVVYSGDMTNADPEASELLYIRGNCPDGVVRVNRFRGRPESKFRFFVANEAVADPTSLLNHMVDPNGVKLDTMVEVGAVGGEKAVGLVHDNALTLMDLSTGNGRVANGPRTITDFVRTMAGRTDCFLRLRDILEEAGFVEDAEHPDLDLTNLGKDTLLDLLR